MLDLSQLVTAHPFPSALDRVRRSFARQPDNQTCGAAAIRHGLLLGGLTVPAAILEAVLDIRCNQGTPPAILRACLQRLGLGVHTVRKRARQSTAAFLDSMGRDLEQGAFLLPCIHAGEHWVCLGAWQDGRVGLVDSFFGKEEVSLWHNLSPGLGFFSLTPAELDALDWAHHVTLVRPGCWRSQYEAWLPARAALLRMHQPQGAPQPRSATIVGAVRQGVHQYLDDADYSYAGLTVHLPAGQGVRIEVHDPGHDALGVQMLGKETEEVVVMRRLGGLLSGRLAPPELVLRASAVRAFNLAGETAPQAGAALQARRRPA
jgi:hypothetical protein